MTHIRGAWSLAAMLVALAASTLLNRFNETSGAHLAGPVVQIVVSRDASVVLFAFASLSVEECQVNTPLRNDSDGLYLRRVRAVRKRPGNHGPVLRRLCSLRVLAGEPLTLLLSATDSDGDPIVFFAQLGGGFNIPRGSQITDHHDGTATFNWSTTVEQVGLYQLRMAAFDEGGGETFDDITLAVCSRILADGDLRGVLTALFISEPPAPCRDADLNQDRAISAADLVKSVSGQYARAAARKEILS